MELALSLGDTPKPFSFLEKSQKILSKDLGFCMAAVDNNTSSKAMTGINSLFKEKPAGFSDSSSDPPVQLDLLPFSPVQKTQPPSNNFPFTWLNEKLGGESGRSGPEINRKLGDDQNDREAGTDLSSPNTTSTVSAFQMDFSIFGSRNKRDFEQINEYEADKGSDDEENGSMARKKLRLSKQQSAFLEESFKEHNTLNPKQKIALAKQLNLRPRQVEVWFQNRRARTKLKQTEVDCEYLKKCCETLTEENRRLQKELQELRALKAASQPFYMQRPATTLTMCPSCERVAAASPATTTTTSVAAIVSNNNKKNNNHHLSLSSPSCHDINDHS